MLTNTTERTFEIIELTNEMPINRMGGVGTMIENLIRGFDEQQVRVLWYLTDHAYSASQVEAILTTYPSVAVGTSAEMAMFEAPVFHVHSYQIHEALIERLRQQVSVCTVHSLLALEEASNDVNLSDAVAMQEELIKTCDEVVLISEAERRSYWSLGYQHLNPRVRVIHNGLDPATPFRIRSRKHTLGYCGRLVPRKHPEYVQRILLEPGFEGTETLIAGRAFSLYARDLLRDLDLDGRVRYLGWCAGRRLEAFYDAIDVLAIPSIYEPFGYVALEATARGIPVVATRVDGLTEVLGPNAFYSESDGYGDFRAAMFDWLEADGREIRQLADGARHRFERRFTHTSMVHEYLRQFAELVENSYH